MWAVETHPSDIDLEKSLQDELDELALIPDEQLSLSDSSSDDDLTTFRQRISAVRRSGYSHDEPTHFSGSDVEGKTPLEQDGVWQRYMGVLKQKEEDAATFHSQLTELHTLTNSVDLSAMAASVPTLNTDHQKRDLLGSTASGEQNMQTDTRVEDPSLSFGRKATGHSAKREEVSEGPATPTIHHEIALKREKERQQRLAEEAERDHKRAQRRLQRRKEMEVQLKREREEQEEAKRRLELEMKEREEAACRLAAARELKRREMEAKREERKLAQRAHTAKLRLLEERRKMEAEDSRSRHLTMAIRQHRLRATVDRERRLMALEEENARLLSKRCKLDHERKAMKLHDRQSRKLQLHRAKEKLSSLHKERLRMEYEDGRSMQMRVLSQRKYEASLIDERKRMAREDLASVRFTESILKKKEEENRQREATRKRKAEEKRRRVESAAALSIQRWWRMAWQRSLFIAMKNSALQNSAALKIQRWWKMTVAVYELKRLRRVHQVRVQYAIVIQTRWRGFVCREKLPYRRMWLRRLKERSRVRKSAAIKIQAVFRGHRLRRRRDQVLQAAHAMDWGDDSDEFEYEGVDESFFTYESNVNLEGDDELATALSAAASVFDGKGPVLSGGGDNPSSPVAFSRHTDIVASALDAPNTTEANQYIPGSNATPLGRTPTDINNEEKQFSREEACELPQPAEGKCEADEGFKEKVPSREGEKLADLKKTASSSKLQSLADQWGFKDPRTAAAMLRKSRKWTKASRRKTKKKENPVERYEKIKGKISKSQSMMSTSVSSNSDSIAKSEAGESQRVARRNTLKGRRGSIQLSKKRAMYGLSTPKTKVTKESIPVKTAWVGSPSGEGPDCFVDSASDAQPFVGQTGPAQTEKGKELSARKRAHVRASRSSRTPSGSFSTHGEDSPRLFEPVSSPTFGSCTSSVINSSHFSLASLSDASSTAEAFHERGVFASSPVHSLRGNIPYSPSANLSDADRNSMGESRRYSYRN